MHACMQFDRHIYVVIMQPVDFLVEKVQVL